MKEPREPRERRAIDEFEEWGEGAFLDESGGSCPELVRRGVAIFSQNPDWCRRFMMGPEVYMFLYSRMQKRLSRNRRVFVIAPPPTVREQAALPDGAANRPLLPSGNGEKPSPNDSAELSPLGNLAGPAGRWDLCVRFERIDGNYVPIRHMTAEMWRKSAKVCMKNGVGWFTEAKRRLRIAREIEAAGGDTATTEDVFATPEEAQAILEGTDGNSAAQTESLQGEFPEFTSPEEVQ